MAKLKFKDENNEFIPVVQDVKVNNSSVFDGKDANIKLKTINNESIVGTGNIEIQSEGEYVKYTSNQGLTDQQKLNARNNIGALGRADVKQQTGTSTTDVMSQKGVSDELAKKQDNKPNGTTPLIASDTGKLSLAYMPSTILGGITNGGTFNTDGTITASSYAPELDGMNINNVPYGTYPSYYFIYNGENGEWFFGYQFARGDWAISLGNGWAKLNSTDAVTSVNGQMGEVILTADDIGAIVKYWGNDNANKNLVTNASGEVIVSDFALGQILVDNYMELPNVNPDAPHQDIPVNARATVRHSIDLYPSVPIDDIITAMEEGEALPQNKIVIFSPSDRPYTNGTYLYLGDENGNLDLYYNDDYSTDPAFRAEFVDNETGNSVLMFYSFTEQPFAEDSSVTLYQNNWTKVTYDDNTGQWVGELSDHNEIPQLHTPIYVFDDNALDLNFMSAVRWDDLKSQGDYIYQEVTPVTDPPTYYWKFSPSNVQADWGQQNPSELDYVKNKPFLRTNISSSLPVSDNIGEEIVGTLRLHKISKTGKYSDLIDTVGRQDLNNGGEIFNNYTGSYANTAGTSAHAEGTLTVATGNSAHAEGSYNRATGVSSHAEGANTVAGGDFSHAEGQYTTASGNSSHVEGANYSQAIGTASHAEGYGTSAGGAYSHAEGQACSASGTASHSEGANCSASSGTAHAEGSGSTASGASSHAEGYFTLANGLYAHAEGMSTVASGQYAHAEGGSCEATVIGSHAEGYYCRALADFSHAEGYSTTVQSSYGHAQNLGTIARYAQTTIGKYNIDDTQSTKALIIGNGETQNARSNCMTVDWNGNVWVQGDVRVGGTDYSTGKKLTTVTMRVW